MGVDEQAVKHVPFRHPQVDRHAAQQEDQPAKPAAQGDQDKGKTPARQIGGHEGHGIIEDHQQAESVDQARAVKDEEGSKAHPARQVTER